MSFKRDHVRLGLVLLALALGGCDCEDRLRRALSDPGQRGAMSQDAGALNAEAAAAASSTEPEEQEPNDERASASRYELGVELRAMRGVLSSRRDVDWYLLGSSSDELLELNVEPEDAELDLQITLMGGDNAELLYDVSRAGQIESVPRVRVHAHGALALKITSRAGSGRYRLTARRSLSAAALEAELNDSWEDALKAGASLEIQGFYDRPGDIDRFEVGAEEASSRVELSGIEGVTQRVTLYRGEAPVWSRQLARGEPLRLNHLYGRWRLELATGESMSSRQRPYMLRVIPSERASSLKPNELLEREPNDPSEEGEAARPLAMLSEEALVVLGEVSASEDLDLIHLDRDVSQRALIEYSVISESPQSKLWYAVGEAGERVQLGEASLEQCVILGPGEVMPTWLVGASSPPSLAKPALYRVEVSALALDQLEARSGLEHEPNETQASSNALDETTRRARGRIDRVGDLDWYRFEVEQEAMIRVGVEAHRLDLKLRLVDDEGGLIAEVQRAGAGSIEETSLRLPPGEYAVEVSANQQSACEEYELFIEAGPEP